MTIPPCVIVLFGATGDLAKRKLIPALHDLEVKGLLHKSSRIIAIGRRDYTDDDIRRELNSGLAGWRKFAKRISYHNLEFSDPKAYDKLLSRINRLPKSIKDNRLFYLATPQQAFGEIVGHLSRTKLASKHPRKGWHRVVFEKPFGSDLKSARKLNKTITKLFREEQIYRIDHYLGKSLVREILALRFANPVFRDLWGYHHIRRVQIEVYETEGVGSRAGYYDGSGALRDMVQNHLLQLLSFIVMNHPESLSAEDIRDAKIKALKQVQIQSKREARKNLVCGQYRGYLKEKGVAKDSRTETFALVNLFMKNSRWKGVPFVLATGKAVKEQYAEILIEFGSEGFQLFKDPLRAEAENVLVIRIQPNEGLFFTFNMARGQSNEVGQHLMEYCHDASGMNTPEAYELLLQEAMTGDQTLFTRWDFVEQSWKIVDNLRASVDTLHMYSSGSHGPTKAMLMLKRDYHWWAKKARKECTIQPESL